MSFTDYWKEKAQKRHKSWAATIKSRKKNQQKPVPTLLQAIEKVVELAEDSKMDWFGQLPKGSTTSGRHRRKNKIKK